MLVLESFFRFGNYFVGELGVGDTVGVGVVVLEWVVLGF